MSSTTEAEPTEHPIARFSNRLHVALDGLLEVPCWSMTPDEQRSVLLELTRAEARIGELRLRVLAAADRGEVGAESGASSPAAWVAAATRRVGAVARAEVRLARLLDEEEFAATREALARGARVTYLHLFDNGDGTHTGRFKVASLHAAMLRKLLEAFIGPRSTRSADEPQGDGAQQPVVSRPEQLGQAFGDLLERIPAGRVPKSGGVSATVVVLLDYDKLLSGIGVAQLDTGDHISASQARRLACEAGIIPVVHQQVLGARSVVLDMGRRTRFHTEHQRIAMSTEQGGCTAHGCDRPSGWCHAHHPVAWADGGHTSIRNGRLLCPFHHGTAHHPSYQTTELPDGRLRFHRRT